MPPCSHSLRIEAVTMRQRGLIRKIMADRLVIWRVKLKINPARKAGTINGSVTLRNVYCASAPNMPDASSIDGSICCKAAMPLRTEAGRLVPRRQR